ncbi:MAG: hypothetical protein ACR2FY_04430 [Pirellulaceae bacterium]
MFTISASVTGAGMDSGIVGCFDPTVVIARLRRAFPDVEVIPQDFAWRDYDAFLQRGALEGASAVAGAMRIAEIDARRRGPIWTFRFPLPGRPPICGRAERYDVSIWSDDPVPEPLRSQFIEFLEGLRFAPFVNVTSVRLEGNDQYPAQATLHCKSCRNSEAAMYISIGDNASFCRPSQEENWLSLESDGYYWFLDPLFKTTLLQDTGQCIDLYGHAVFEGENLRTLRRFLAQARAIVQSQPETWDVHTGTQVTPVYKEFYSPVERERFLELIAEWERIVRRAQRKKRRVVCFGD